MSKEYWNQRYAEAKTGWDIGYANQALTQYIESTSSSKDLKILIPGAGKGYEGEYLWSLGFTNVYLLDIAPLAKEEFLTRVPDFPESQYLIQDFFTLEQDFDVILEQTFFCALQPEQRPVYTQKMNELLKEEGILAGVLFNFEKPEGPPFGGSEVEYRSHFQPYFNILRMEDCYNSIQARQGNEFFFELKKL